MMYETFFGLNSPPFKITPDPAFLYWTKNHRLAGNTLTMGVELLVPITVVSGDVGTGKTTLLRQFLDDAPNDLTIGLISNFSSGLGGIYRWIAKAFGLSATETGAELHRKLENFMLEEYAKGRRCVLLVDEAQNISEDDLEKLRMLTNINSGHDVVLQLFLIGQQELRARLLQPNNRQIAQRVGAAFQLGPMSKEDTKKYVRHRLSIAGSTREIFSDEAVAKIHEVAGGVPRLINLICEIALMEAFGDGAETIDRAFMEDLLKEAAANGTLAHLPLATTSGEPSSARPETAPIPKRVGDLQPVAHRRNKAPVHSKTSKIEPLVLTQSRARMPGTSRPVQSNEKQESAPGPRKSVKAELMEETAIRAGIAELEPEAAATPRPSLPTKMKLALVDFRKATPRRTPLTIPGKAAVGTLALLAAVLLYNAVPPRSGEEDAQQTAVVLPRGQAESFVAGVANDPATPLPPEPVPLDNPGGAALLEQALELGFSEPGDAALAYARAALRGEDQAAYYLGQLYETGVGVPRSLALARAWYERASETVRSARRRLDGIGPSVSVGDLAPPIPVLGGPLAGGGAEFVWTIGDGSDPKFYLVESADARNGAVTRSEPQTRSAMQTETIGPARIWRVLSADPETAQYAVSDWAPMGSDPDASALGNDPVMPVATITTSQGHSQARLEEITASLTSAGIPFEIVERAHQDDRQSAVHHVYDADQAHAERVAAILSIPAVQVGPAASDVMPGQLIITLVP